MKSENHEELLSQCGLKKTKVRTALLLHFMNMKHAQSYSDLQLAMAKEVDKSTLYRNLTSFEQAGIIHRINDHTGVSKYAFGAAPIQGNGHAHFVCECCETVYCMDEPGALQPKVPKGFKANQVQTIIRGICAAC